MFFFTNVDFPRPDSPTTIRFSLKTFLTAFLQTWRKKNLKEAVFFSWPSSPARAGGQNQLTGSGKGSSTCLGSLHQLLLPSCRITKCIHLNLLKFERFFYLQSPSFDPVSRVTAAASWFSHPFPSPPTFLTEALPTNKGRGICDQWKSFCFTVPFSKLYFYLQALDPPPWPSWEMSCMEMEMEMLQGSLPCQLPWLGCAGLQR